MTFEELQALLGYDALAPMYQDLGGQGDPFYAANPEGGPGQYLGVQGAQAYNQFDPSFFDPYTFDWNPSGPGNSGTVSAFKDGQQQGSWSQYDTPFSETAMDALMTAGVAFGGLGLAGYGPAAGMFGAGGGAAGSMGANGAFLGEGVASGVGAWDAAAGLGSLGGGAAGAAGSGSVFGGSLPEFGMGGMGGGSALGGGASAASWIPGISNGAALSIGGNLLSGYMGQRASGKASDALLQAGRESNALQKQMYDQTRADFAPYREAGYGALTQMQNLLKDPSSLAQQGDYQFGLNQGIKARDQSAASNGMLYSGAQQKALTQYGNDYANTKLNESYNRLAGLAGTGQQATGSTAAAGQNYGNQVGNTLQGMGNARASGYVGGANAWSNAFGNIGNLLQQQDVYKNPFGG
jgi:hypothetical protein